MARTPLAVLCLLCWGLVVPTPLAWAEGARAGEAPAFGHVLAGLGSSSPEVRRAALADLDARGPLSPAEKERALRPLAAMLRRGPPTEAAAAVRVVAGLAGDKSRRLWLGALDPELDPRVFLSAVEASRRRRGDAASVRALLEGARDVRRPFPERALLLDALGAFGGAGARTLLVHPLARCGAPVPEEVEGAEPWLLASGRALGLGRLGGRAAGEALLDLLDHPHEAPRIHAWEMLVHLTRTALPPSAKAWRAWWEAHPEALRGSASAPAPAVADPRDRYEAAEPAHVPHYYGVPIDRPRSHVVFCLDVSQSMYGRGIEQARGELTRTLISFPSTYAFDVVAFNERLFPFAALSRRRIPVHAVAAGEEVFPLLRRIAGVTGGRFVDAFEFE